MVLNFLNGKFGSSLSKPVKIVFEPEKYQQLLKKYIDEHSNRNIYCSELPYSKGVNVAHFLLFHINILSKLNIMFTMLNACSIVYIKFM